MKFDFFNRKIKPIKMSDENQNPNSQALAYNLEEGQLIVPGISITRHGFNLLFFYLLWLMKRQLPESVKLQALGRGQELSAINDNTDIEILKTQYIDAIKFFTDHLRSNSEEEFATNQCYIRNALKIINGDASDTYHDNDRDVINNLFGIFNH